MLSCAAERCQENLLLSKDCRGEVDSENYHFRISRGNLFSKHHQELPGTLLCDVQHNSLSLPWPNYSARGCKILQQVVDILPSHCPVTCYSYKEVHVTAKCDCKFLLTTVVCINNCRSIFC